MQHVAMRGGTVLHKAHLAPAARYSEDIDLVLVTQRPEAHIRKALQRVLEPVLGSPAGVCYWIHQASDPKCSRKIENSAFDLLL